MNTNYPAAILANFDGDYQKAYAHLSKVYNALNRQFTEQTSSRFFEISRFEPDSPICLRQVTEESISRDVDMADCSYDYVMLKRFYVDDAGEIQPVTIGSQERAYAGEEAPFYYAHSAIMAGGRQVGTVTHTDH